MSIGVAADGMRCGVQGADCSQFSLREGLRLNLLK